MYSLRSQMCTDYDLKEKQHYTQQDIIKIIVPEGQMAPVISVGIRC